ncbi:uncharacterized protein LOC143104117 [Alosa pseudoharengus]|uniref:uncharacterized protein LOC143104117 n=1 Tax=Alosa pseudoharengus TaxID=34774 RepID=UPI003F8C5A59
MFSGGKQRGPGSLESPGSPGSLASLTNTLVQVTGLSPLAGPSNAEHTTTQLANDNFQRKVLMKLDLIIEQQQQILNLTRQNMTPGNDTENVLDHPCETLEDLERLEKEMEDRAKKQRMTMYLRSLGGANLNAAVRRMLRRVGNNDLWSTFSYKGRLGKRPFSKLRLCEAMIGACQKLFKIKADAAEDAIGQALKLAPHRKLK